MNIMDIFNQSEAFRNSPHYELYTCLNKSPRPKNECLTIISAFNGIYVESPEDIQSPDRNNSAFLPIIITHTLTFFIGITGNLIVIITWVKNGKIRSPTIPFLVSLAIADLLLLVICVPHETLKYFVITWDAGGSICKLSSYVEMLSGIASILNLVAVSFERFLVIVYPIKARRLCTLSNSRKGLVIVWSLAIILALPVSFTKHIYPMTYYNNSTSLTAYYCWDTNDDWAFLIAIYQLLIIFAIPALLMIIFYFYVIKALWISTHTIAEMTQGTNAFNSSIYSSSRNSYQVNWPSGKHERAIYPRAQGFEVRKARKQVIKMLIFVVAIFLLCWGPRLIMNVIIKLGLVSFTQTAYSVRIGCFLLSFIHSAINPFIYGFMSSNFRKIMCISCSSHTSNLNSTNFQNHLASCSGSEVHHHYHHHLHHHLHHHTSDKVESIQSISKHSDVFDNILSRDDNHNLKGHNKMEFDSFVNITRLTDNSDNCVNDL